MKNDLLITIKTSLLKIKSILHRDDLVFITILSGGFLVILFSIMSISSLNQEKATSLKPSKSAVSVNDPALRVEPAGAVVAMEVPAVEGSELGEVIWLDIGGAVKKPGIYSLKRNTASGNRLFQLIDLAGGFTQDADQFYLAQNLNLAMEIHDAQKIFVPFRGITMINTEASKTPGGEIDPVVVSQSTKKMISVNSGTNAELQTLKGVGQVRADNIINGRPYASLEELIEKKILTQKIVDDNHELLSL